MSFLKALIIHPEREVTTRLREFLSKESRVKVLGEAMTSFEALELLENISYDVFFLGINLPSGVDGVELAQILNQRKKRPNIVFVADDESLAYKAFEVGATDYLVWPFSSSRVAKTIERLHRFSSQTRIVDRDKPDNSSLQEDLEEETVQLNLADVDEDSFLTALRQAWDVNRGSRLEIEKLPINLDGKMILVPYNQIVFVEAYEDYSFVHTSQEKFLTSYRLKNLEERLNRHGFFRVHRKYLVNLEMVTEIASLPGSNFMLRTAGRKKIELPISRRRISELKQILGL
ncbi:LytR/AlgR family response regulator transcription factor [Desulfonatronovibrio hydrogenovorans]|uniref:LytR/AlgR family response regulator transcription factor n=1 Tax=Desulfonatronovibrio hydrogenovorans TaxID=53245 RepID=UPI0004909FB0|nr:LytTR family DNA-binding domain-containing protein [Desulfonatronovibrio hydrogenovorans]